MRTVVDHTDRDGDEVDIAWDDLCYLLAWFPPHFLLSWNVHLGIRSCDVAGVIPVLVATAVLRLKGYYP